MIRLREALKEQLTRNLDRHRVVVWADPHGEYRRTAADLAPEDATFESYRGSWYELRRRAEPELSRLEPRLLVYVHADEPEEDPLAELRALGTTYTQRLGTLLREAAKGELTTAKLDEITDAAVTLEEAEALLEGSATGSPARLLKVVGPHEPNELVLKLAISAPAAIANDTNLFGEVVHFLDTHVGVRPEGPDDLGGTITRHLVLAELTSAIRELPQGLRYAYHVVSAEQQRRCEAVLHRWKNDQRLVRSFDEAMSRASEDLALFAQLDWHDALTDIDTVPAYDGLALGEYMALLDRGQFRDAEDLATARLVSRWVKNDQTQEKLQVWRVAHVAAQLRRLISEGSRSPDRSVPYILRDYAEYTWQIDRAHRRLESALLALTDRERIEPVVLDARQAYEEWLDDYLRRFTAAADNDGLATGDILLQSQVHRNVVAPYVAAGPVGYFMVDALRYELTHDLVDALARQFGGGDIQLRPAVGLVPSITKVGMANLCPGADEGLTVALTDDNRLVVYINGQQVMTPADRVARLRAADGRVADLRLDDIVRLSERELTDQVEGANLVLVRSQEIDEQGETGKLNIGLSGFDATVQQLSRAVARLARHGIAKFVISSDHGFLALTRDVGEHMIIPKPGAKGNVHRRVFTGKGGTIDAAALRLPMSKIGLPGDLDVVVPRGLALIAAGGARGFFHGGLSPQEVLVPVLTVEVQPSSGSAMLSVDARIASTITSHIFTGTLVLPDNLLSERVTVRPVPVRISDERQVGVLVTAGGAEQGEGLVRLEPGDEVTLGFRVTTSLVRGDKVALRAFDARTDRTLGESTKTAAVARRLEVDDELA